MIKTEYRYKVTHSATKTFKPGDIVRPIKKTMVGWLIGLSYHKSLYFDFADSVTAHCHSAKEPEKILVSIERIK
nr:hypothetical protein NTNURWAK_00052 [Escherichia phage morffagbaw]